MPICNRSVGAGDQDGRITDGLGVGREVGGRAVVDTSVVGVDCVSSVSTVMFRQSVTALLLLLLLLLLADCRRGKATPKIIPARQKSARLPASSTFSGRGAR